MHGPPARHPFAGMRLQAAGTGTESFKPHIKRFYSYREGHGNRACTPRRGVPGRRGLQRQSAGARYPARILTGGGTVSQTINSGQEMQFRCQTAYPGQCLSRRKMQARIVPRWHTDDCTTVADRPAPRTLRSFVRREGRMTSGQLRALHALWPKYGLDPGIPLSPEGVFGRRAPLTLEIGFGNGDALLAMAQAVPHEDFIGIEVHRPGVGHLLLELEQHGLENVRIYNEDAVQLLRTSVPDECLDRVLLFFPDPWHRRRHHKRRLVQPGFIELLAHKLRTGGILHLATDWEDYAGHMLAVVEASGLFGNCAGPGQYAARPGYRPVTKFERRGHRLGHAVRDLLFERR